MSSLPQTKYQDIFMFNTRQLLMSRRCYLFERKVINMFYRDYRCLLDQNLCVSGCCFRETCNLRKSSLFNILRVESCLGAPAFLIESRTLLCPIKLHARTETIMIPR